MRYIFLFFIVLFSLLSRSMVITAEEEVHSPSESSEDLTIHTSAKEKEQRDQLLQKLPSSLLSKPFEASARIVLDLDGSEEAGNIKRRSETMNKVLYINPESWRAIREHPFNKTSLEVLQSPQGSFTMTQTNRRVSNEEVYTPQMWIEILMYAKDLSQKWGFFSDAQDFGDWLTAVEKANGQDLANAEQDKLKINIVTENGQKQIQLVFDGVNLHEGKTKLNTRVEWVLKTGVTLTPNDLNASLIMGDKS